MIWFPSFRRCRRVCRVHVPRVQTETARWNKTARARTVTVSSRRSFHTIKRTVESEWDVQKICRPALLPPGGECTESYCTLSPYVLLHRTNTHTHTLRHTRGTLCSAIVLLLLPSQKCLPFFTRRRIVRIRDHLPTERWEWVGPAKAKGASIWQSSIFIALEG